MPYLQLYSKVLGGENKIRADCRNNYGNPLFNGDSMITIDAKMPRFIKEILIRLNSSGYKAYAVGGCIRDVLSGDTPDDWDLCTSASPKEVKDCLDEYKIIETGILHGTVTAIKNGQSCEITTFRKEGSYNDHRHPDKVYFTSEIDEDLARRDFTINAMAYNIGEPLIDLFGGEMDLNSKIIKCVGIPKKRFEEDALRMLRALRFSACLGFEIEAATKKAIFSCRKLIESIAKERITHELRRLICGKSAYAVIWDFSAIFDDFFPETNLSEKSSLLETAPDILPLRLALLLSDVSPAKAQAVLKELKFDNSTIGTVIFLLERAEEKWIFEKIKMRKLLSEIGREKAKLLFEFLFIKYDYSFDEKTEIKNSITDLTIINLSSLAVNGYDIAKLGIQQGKEIGKALKAALTAVLEEVCENKKSNILEFLKEQGFVK